MTGDATNDFTQGAPSAQITFAKDFTQLVTGSLFEGERAAVTYDPDRVQDCRKGDGDPHHGPTYAYTMHYRWRADAPFVSTLVANENGSAPKTLVVPFGAQELTIYFDLANPNGCQVYDSANGANFHFPVKPARLDVVHFRADGSVGTDRDLAGGQPVLVDYAPSRMPSCTNSGRTMRAFARVDGEDVTGDGVVLATDEGAEDAVAQIPTKPGAKTLTLWFEAVDFHACVEWDSNAGQNFTFPLH